MPAHSLIVAALYAVSAGPLSMLPAEPDPPTLVISNVAGNVEISVGGHDEIFLGAVIGSLAGDVSHYLTGLPPLLSNHVVIGVGIGYPDGGYMVSLPESALPAGVPIYAQGVTLTEPGLLASDVQSFELPSPSSGG